MSNQPPVDEGSEALPRRFGPYTLVALLGRGGMGEVFLAMRGGIEGIARRCVVKTLRPGFGDDREYVARFLDEARVVVQLLHRNICPVFDVGKVDGRYYLAMEYIAGRDLRSVVDRLRGAGRPLHDPAHIGLSLHIIAETLEALEHAHSLTDPATGDPLHLVHRDVSPHNVMIGFDGDVRLIDFGLAASTLKAEHTAPNVVMGKVAYMSPEQICGDPLDAAADQFSAAMMAVELLTGERFYGAMSNRDVYARAATGGFRPPAMAALPPGLRAILDRALAAERTSRFPSCAAFRAALDTWRYDHGVRGDGPALRAVMREVFSADMAADRALLSTAATAAGLAPDALGTRPVSSAGPPSDTDRNDVPAGATMSVASAPRSPWSASAPAALADDGSAMTMSAKSAPALLAEVGTPPPSRRPVVAAAAAVGVVIAVVVVALLTRPPPTTDTSPPAPPAVTTLAVTTPTQPPPAPPPTPPAAPPIATTTTTTPAGPPDTGPTTPGPTTGPTTPGRPKPKPTPAPVPAPAPAPAPVPVAPPPPPAPVVARKPAPPSAQLTGAQITWLTAHCPSLPCAHEATGRRATWATLAPAELVQFKARLQACVDVCARK